MNVPEPVVKMHIMPKDRYDTLVSDEKLLGDLSLILVKELIRQKKRGEKLKDLV